MDFLDKNLYHPRVSQSPNHKTTIIVNNQNSQTEWPPECFQPQGQTQFLLLLWAASTVQDASVNGAVTNQYLLQKSLSSLNLQHTDPISSSPSSAVSIADSKQRWPPVMSRSHLNPSLQPISVPTVDPPVECWVPLSYTSWIGWPTRPRGVSGWSMEYGSMSA